MAHRPLSKKQRINVRTSLLDHQSWFNQRRSVLPLGDSILCSLLQVCSDPHFRLQTCAKMESNSIYGRKSVFIVLLCTRASHSPPSLLLLSMCMPLPSPFLPILLTLPSLPFPPPSFPPFLPPSYPYACSLPSPSPLPSPSSLLPPPLYLCP